MEYLVESHMGGYYVSNSDPDIIEAFCEQCGDHDNIILSFEDGKILDALLKYFSRIRMLKEELEREKSESIITLEELIDSLTWTYNEERYLICELAEDDNISLEEKKILLKQVTMFQKKQFEILKSVYYPKGYTRVKRING